MNATTARDALLAWAREVSRTDVSIAAPTPLFESGGIDSVHLLDLILLVEELAGRAVEIEDLEAGSFRSVDRILTQFFCGAPRDGD